MPSFVGARAKLKTATQDLFRLSGGNSIPVEARSAPEPVVAPARAPEKAAEDPSSARKPEASIMFSLEELMKANPVSVKQEEAPDQLWNMQAATPLFGTAHDQALLTTPMKKEPSPSTDSMTMPSRAPLARRWLPLGLAIGGTCLGIAAAGWWFTGQSQAESASPAAVLEAPAVATAAVAPAPAVSVATSAPSSEDQLAAAPPTVAPGDVPQPGDAPTAAATPAGEAAAPPASAAPDEKVKSSKKPPTKAAPSSTARKPAAAFDKGAAKAALSTAAAKASGCGAGGAPGKGKVMLTFAPSGKVSSASLVEGPFAGKAAGACALKHFRAASVPAFSGSAVTVSKSFSVQ